MKIQEMEKEILNDMLSMFRELPIKAWDQGDGNNPANVWEEDHERTPTLKDLKQVLQKPCCFGAKVAAYFDLVHPEVMGGRDSETCGFHGFMSALSMLSKVFGATEFHIHRALVEAGAPNHPLGCVPYEVSQPEVLEKLIKMEKMPHLEHYDFSTISIYERDQTFKNLDFTGSSFEGLDFKGAGFQGCSFSDARITGSGGMRKLQDCNVKDAFFQNVNFFGCVFEFVSFENCQFRHVNFNEAVFVNCDLTDASFVTCSFADAKIEDKKNLPKVSKKCRPTMFTNTLWKKCEALPDLWEERIKAASNTNIQYT